MEDVVSTKYKELFTVKLAHAAYTAASGRSIFERLTVIPDDATKKLFSRYNIDYRCLGDSVVCFVRSELASPPAKEPKVPYVLFDEDIVIRFLIGVQSSFINNTYITAAGSKAVYYFTNKINNIQDGKSYITKTIEAYDAGKDYDAGTIVSQGAEPYATLLPVNGSDGIALNNTTYWKKLLPLEPVVNNADIKDVASVEITRPCFAVIDVFNSGTSNTTYDLYSGDQHLLSPVYFISFKSRI